MSVEIIQNWVARSRKPKLGYFMLEADVLLVCRFLVGTLIPCRAVWLLVPEIHAIALSISFHYIPEFYWSCKDDWWLWKMVWTIWQKPEGSLTKLMILNCPSKLWKWGLNIVTAYADTPYNTLKTKYFITINNKKHFT